MRESSADLADALLGVSDVLWGWGRARVRQRQYPVHSFPEPVLPLDHISLFYQSCGWPEIC